MPLFKPPFQSLLTKLEELLLKLGIKTKLLPADRFDIPTIRAFWGRLEMVRLLLDRGADAHIKAERDATALSVAKRVLPDAARKQDYEEVINFLSERISRR